MGHHLLTFTGVRFKVRIRIGLTGFKEFFPTYLRAHIKLSLSLPEDWTISLQPETPLFSPVSITCKKEIQNNLLHVAL